MTVESTGFRFYTRTRSEDYRVFENDGANVIPYEEFESFYVKAEIENEDEESAIIFSDGGTIYTAAFGLRTGRLDIAGREIRFSFCAGLPEGKTGAAMRIFSRVISEWDNTASTVSKLIQEIPTTRRDWKDREKRGEDVRFDFRKFLHWLTEKPSDPQIKFPPKGMTLKYFSDSGELALIRDDDDESDGESYTGSRKKNPLLIICAALALILCAGLGTWHFMRGRESENSHGKSQTQKQEYAIRVTTSPDNQALQQMTSQDTKTKEDSENGRDNSIDNININSADTSILSPEKTRGEINTINHNDTNHSNNPGGGNTSGNK